MRTRGNRTNNGYIGDNDLTDRDSGIIHAQKIYHTALRERPEGVPEELQESNSYGIVTGNYRRPAEWVAMPSVSEGDNKFAGIYAVYDTDSNWVSMTVSVSSGTYTVDWGNGVTSAHTSGTAAYYNYDRNTYAGMTSAVFRGYKTLPITITPTTSGANLTVVNLQTKHNQSGLASYYSNGWLDIKMSAPSLTSILVSGTNQSNYSRASKLEQFDFIGTANSLNTFSFLGCNSLRKIINFPSTRNATNTDWTSRFHSCYVLQEVPAQMFDGIWRATSTNFLFYYCFSLKSVPPLNTSNATSLQQMFESCRSLRRVPYLNTSKATNLYGIFNSCVNLETAPYLDTRLCQNFGYAFGACRMLKNIQTNFPGTSFTNLSGTFSNTNIQHGPTFGSTSLVTTFDSMLTGCQSLVSVPKYNYSSATDIDYMFRYCSALKEIPDMNTTSALTSAIQVFEFAHTLCRAPGITLTNVTNATSMFNGCYNMHTIPRINMNSLTTTTTMFQTCYSLAECGVTGMKETFSISGCGMGSTALNNLYTSLATVVGKTIIVTGNWGTVNDNPTIATSKGWTVTG